VHDDRATGDRFGQSIQQPRQPTVPVPGDHDGFHDTSLSKSS
jgi:hypothetical protein